MIPVFSYLVKLYIVSISKLKYRNISIDFVCAEA